MKRVLIAALLAITFGVGLEAWSGFAVACSKDNKQVSLPININDEVAGTHPVRLHIIKAFTEAAASLPAAEFVEAAGYQAFVNLLDDTDLDATSIGGAPSIGPACKGAK